MGIKSLISDLKPDSWVTFYLFYFNQGIGSDASFRLDNELVHVFIGTLMSAHNNDVIIDTINKKHELASGEFMHILTQLMMNDDEICSLESAVGAVLFINEQSGEAKSF